jgi:ATP/maltotriose-dependent transcriptional regulator MalT
VLSPKWISAVSNEQRPSWWLSAAPRMSISPPTAKTHVQRILAKLDCHDRAQLVALAYDTGLVTPGTTIEPGRAGG